LLPRSPAGARGVLLSKREEKMAAIADFKVVVMRSRLTDRDEQQIAI